MRDDITELRINLMTPSANQPYRRILVIHRSLCIINLVSLERKENSSLKIVRSGTELNKTRKKNK